MRPVITLIITLFVALPALAETSAQPKIEAVPEAPKILRVGGDYTVSSIDKAGEGAFKIEFKAVTPSGRFDTLKLESDHVHVAVRVGQKIRLSAEILAEAGPSAEVSQLVLFLENPQGPVPVWLLSNKAPAGELRGSRYLEMHAPMNDYQVM